MAADNFTPAEILVGRKVRELRTKQCLSLRALAERSGLNFNTLCLVENGKTSPSIGTLQQLATALDVPLSTFFDADPLEKRVVFTPADERPQAAFGSTHIQNLGKNLAGNAVQPLMVTLQPGMAAAIADCKAILCGGMGMGAYESMRRLSIQPVVTDLRDIEAAAQAFIDGKLIDHTELLH